MGTRLGLLSLPTFSPLTLVTVDKVINSEYCIRFTNLSESLTNNLYGYWAFENNGEDSHTTNNDLTLYGTYSFITGKNGDAFSGDAYASQSAVAASNFVSSKHSISFWFNIPTGYYGGTWLQLVCNDSSNKGFQFYYDNFYENINVGAANFGEAVVAYAPVSLANDVWHHAAITFETVGGITYISVWINGNKVINQDNSTSFDVCVSAISTATLYVNTNSVPTTTSSSIDEVALWVGKVLTDGDVAELYNNGNGFFYEDMANPRYILPNIETLISLQKDNTGNIEYQGIAEGVLSIDGEFPIEYLVGLAKNNVIFQENLINNIKNNILNKEFLIAFSYPASSSNPLENSLAHYWTMDVSDDADLIGTMDITSIYSDTTYFKKGGSGYAYIALDDLQTYDVQPSNSNSFSYSMWIYIDIIGDTDVQLSLHSFQGDGGPSVSLASYLSLNEDLTTWQLITETYSGMDFATIADPFADLSEGTWYHFSLVYDADTTTMYQYLNGVLRASADISINGGFYDFTTGTKYLYLGNYGASDMLRADEVAFWNRALTSDEVLSLYNSGTGEFYPFEAGTSDSVYLEHGIRVVKEGTTQIEYSVNAENIQITGVIPLEFLANIIIHNSLNLENLIYTLHSYILNKENLLSLSKEELANLEIKLNLNLDNNANLENLISVINNQAAAYEHLLSFLKNQNINIENLTNLLNNNNICLESLIIYNNSERLNIEYLLGLSNSGNIVIEFSAQADNIAVTGQIPIEYITNLSLDSNFNVEALISIFNNYVLQNEALLSLLTNKQILVENSVELRSILNTNVENLILQSSTLNVNSEYLGGVGISLGSALEYLLYANPTVEIPLELLGSISRGGVINNESLAGLQKNESVGLEFLLALGLNRELALEIIEGNIFSFDYAIPIEFLAMPELATPICIWVANRRDTIYIAVSRETLWEAIERGEPSWLAKAKIYEGWTAEDGEDKVWIAIQ